MQDKLTPAEQQRLGAVAKKTQLDMLKAERGRAFDRGFASSFSPYDLLWFLLAIATAFRVGSRLAPAEE